MNLWIPLPAEKKWKKFYLMLKYRAFNEFNLWNEKIKRNNNETRCGDSGCELFCTHISSLLVFAELGCLFIENSICVIMSKKYKALPVPAKHENVWCCWRNRTSM